MTGRGLGTVLSASLPRVLTRTLGPLLRLREGPDASFVDRLDSSHAERMLELGDDHWDGLIDALGLASAGSVLDVGCGAGAWLPAIARANSRVVGVDPDVESLGVARALTASADNVELSVMSAESLDFEDRAFDAVVCFTVLPYLRKSDAVAEIARVLRPGGAIVLGTVGAGYYARHVIEGIRHDRPDVVGYGLDPLLVSAARRIAGDRLARGSLHAWSPRSVRRLLEGSGFIFDRILWDVRAVDPDWPTRYLGRPMYFVTFARRA